MEKKKFKFRAFTALIMLWSLIIETVSGVVLYIVPPGRIAHWTNWELWSLNKEGWEAIHTIFGYLFLIFACIHIYYNWKSILNYVRKKIKAGLRMKIELVTSLLLIVIFFIGTAISIPPFSSIMNLSEKLKNSWEDSQRKPFMPHAELFSFDVFLREIGVSKDAAFEILKAKGIKIKDQNLTIKEIARDNKIAPVEIYNILIKGLPLEEKEKTERIQGLNRTSSGQGYGWKTIEDIAKDVGIPVERAVEILRSKGISVRKGDMLKTIAGKYGKRPVEIVELIKEGR